MEYISGISIADILIHNDNWDNFVNKYGVENIRPSIIDNVEKVIACKNKDLGYSLYFCDSCNKKHLVKFSCKSRFCSSCGKKATDIWVNNAFNRLPDCEWQHITFTLPDTYWNLFWINRQLMGAVPKIAVNILKEIALKYKCEIGVFLVVHTFGRDLKRNYHLHITITINGITICGKKIKRLFFKDTILKAKWRDYITDLLRDEFSKNNMTFPESWNIKSYKDLDIVISNNHKKKWVVNLQKTTDNNNNQEVVAYIARYLKRPPLSQTRIKSYDGKYIAFEYVDHYDNKLKLAKFTVNDFIKRLISHIPDKGFRNVRYYGIMANCNKNTKLATFNQLLEEKKIAGDNKILKNQRISQHQAEQREGKKGKKKLRKERKTDYRSIYKKAFGRDPLMCTNCNIELKLSYSYYASKDSLKRKRILKEKFC